MLFHLLSKPWKGLYTAERVAVKTFVFCCLAPICGMAQAQGNAADGAKVADVRIFMDQNCAIDIADGRSHPLSACYSTMADARRRYPGASELTQEYAGTTIQSALDSLGAAGGTLVLPCGVYLANTTLRITDNKTLQGSGDCTVLKKNGNGSLLVLTGTAAALRDLLVYGNKDQGGQGVGVAVLSATGAVIEDCTITNAQTNGISLFRSANAIIRANRIRGNGHTALLAVQNVDGNRVQDNDIEVSPAANEAAQGVQFRSNAPGMTADGNVISFNRIRIGSRMGYCLEAAGTGGIPAKKDEIVHNQCDLTGDALGGYSIDDAVGAVVKGNTFEANGFKATYTGIELVNTTQALVEDNNIKGGGKLARGIWCSRSITGNLIRGNMISGLAAAGSGIDLVSTALGETVSGNRIEHNVIRFDVPHPDTKGVWLFCQPGTTCNDNQIARNSVVNFGPPSGQGIRLENYGTMDGTVLRENMMYNVAACVEARKDTSTQNAGNVCLPSKPAVTP